MGEGRVSPEANVVRLRQVLARPPKNVGEDLQQLAVYIGLVSQAVDSLNVLFGKILDQQEDIVNRLRSLEEKNSGERE